MTKDQIREYCEAEFENIDTTIKELFIIAREGKEEYTTGELAAIATFIHNFYNGIENILKRMLVLKKEKIEENSRWHKSLLETSSEIGIISQDLRHLLAKYLSFRHFFVHGYGFTLKWEALRFLVENIAKTLQEFKSLIYKQL